MTMYCIYTYFFHMKSTHNVVSNVLIFYPLSIIANYCKCKLQTGCPGCLHVNTLFLWMLTLCFFLASRESRWDWKHDECDLQRGVCSQISVRESVDDNNRLCGLLDFFPPSFLNSQPYQLLWPFALCFCSSLAPSCDKFISQSRSL